MAKGGGHLTRPVQIWAMTWQWLIAVVLRSAFALFLN